MNEKEWEHLLRSEGYSKKEARAVAPVKALRSEMERFTRNLAWSMAWLSYSLRASAETRSDVIMGTGNQSWPDAELSAWERVREDPVAAAAEAGRVASPFIESAPAQPGLRGP